MLEMLRAGGASAASASARVPERPPSTPSRLLLRGFLLSERHTAALQPRFCEPYRHTRTYTQHKHSLESRRLQQGQTGRGGRGLWSPLPCPGPQNSMQQASMQR